MYISYKNDRNPSTKSFTNQIEFYTVAYDIYKLAPSCTRDNKPFYSCMIICHVFVMIICKHLHVLLYYKIGSNVLGFFFFQLSDAVSVIGREDFPDKWTNLLPVSILKYKSMYLKGTFKDKEQNCWRDWL